MVWGCFTYHGVGSLVVLPKNTTMNQGNYRKLLCDHLPGSFEMCQASTFMQDGAPFHTAKSVKEWLRDCCVPFFEDWPANSSDLNPIENLWVIIKRELRSLFNCSQTPSCALPTLEHIRSPASHGACKQPFGPFGKVQETSRETNKVLVVSSINFCGCNTCLYYLAQRGRWVRQCLWRAL